MNVRKKRIYAWILSLALIMSLIPQLSFAAVGNENGIPLQIEFLGVENDDHGGPGVAQSIPSDGLKENDIIWLGISATGITKDKWPVLENNGIFYILLGVNYDANYIVPYTEWDYNRNRAGSGVTAFRTGVTKYTLGGSNTSPTDDTWGTYDYTLNSNATNIEMDVNSKGAEDSTLKSDADAKMLTIGIGANSGSLNSDMRFYQSENTGKQYLAKFPMKIVKTDPNGRIVVELALGVETFTYTIATDEGATVTNLCGGWAKEGYSPPPANNLNAVFYYNGTANLFPAGVQDIDGTVEYTPATVTYGQSVTASLKDGNTTDINWTWTGNATTKNTATYKPVAADAGNAIKATATPSTSDFKGKVEGADLTVEKKEVTLPAAGDITVPSINVGATNKTVNVSVPLTTALGLEAGDTATLTGTATYPDAEKGVKTLTVTFTGISGTSANGYKLPVANTVSGVAGEVVEQAMTGTATVTGTAEYKGKLTASTSGTPAGATVTIKWQSSDDGTTWTDIAGATGTEFTINDVALVGKKVRAIVTADSYTSSDANASAAKTIEKKLLTVPETNPVGAKKVGTTPTGTITIDTVNVNYTAKAAVADGKTFELEADLTLSADDAKGYKLSASTTKITGTVTTRTVTGIAVKKAPDTTTFDYGKPINLKGLEITVTYDVGDTEDILYADFTNKGVTVKGMPAGTANVGSYTLTITYTESTTLNITVVKSDVDLTWTSGDAAHTQRVSSITGVTAPDVTVKVKDGDFVVTEGNPVVEIEITTGGTPAEGECTCEGGSENHDGTNPDCTYIPAVEGTPEWKSFEEAKAIDGALVIGNTYNIRAYYNAAETNANTNPVTSDKAIPGTLKIEQQTSGGHGGGSSMLTVRFDAGVNGKITKGSSTVKVAKNEKLKSSDIPTVTANEGYRFLGWTLDGSKTVDPTKDAVTSSITYRALYNTGATHGVYMRGDSDGNFYPERNITRAEAAALIARLNANYNEGTKYSSSLTDVAAEEWYASAVNFCASSGLITGYDDGTFLPNNQITRQEFCAIVARYLSLNNAGEANFSDIDETIWGAGYISQLAGKGIINGYEDGTFAPNAPIKRCEVVKILNGVFDRTPDASTVNDNIGNYSVRIPDISANHWAYYEILEAAIEHDHADFHKAN